MNTFHTLTIALANKDKTKAMFILRDKSEFAVKKILEKAKIKIPGSSGKLFWSWLQNYIITACRHEQEINNDNQPTVKIESNKPRDVGPDKTIRLIGNDPGSRQHIVPQTTDPGTIFPGKNSVPAVHSHMGNQCKQKPSPITKTCKPALGVVDTNTTHLHNDLHRAIPSVLNEHIIRFRRCDTAASIESQVWSKRHICWSAPTTSHACTAHASELRRPGYRSRNVSSGILLIWPKISKIRIDLHCRVTPYAEWHHLHRLTASRRYSIGHTSNRFTVSINHNSSTAPFFFYTREIHARRVLLLGILRAFIDSLHPGKMPLRVISLCKSIAPDRKKERDIDSLSKSLWGLCA